MSTFIERRTVRGRGTCTFTTQRVEQGKCLISEPYLLASHVPLNTSDTTKRAYTRDASTLRSILTAQPADMQRDFHAMAPTSRSRTEAADMARFLKNCLPLPRGHTAPDSTRVPAGSARALHAVFPSVSRINHSCFPNACFN